jgi:hypothetical protein
VRTGARLRVPRCSACAGSRRSVPRSTPLHQARAAVAAETDPGITAKVRASGWFISLRCPLLGPAISYRRVAAMASCACPDGVHSEFGPFHGNVSGWPSGGRMGRRRVVKCRVAGSRHYTATLISVVLALVWSTALLTSPGAGLVPGAGIVHSGAAARLKPHIVLVLVDDARADDLRPAFMPRSNALIARHGTRFTRFYAPFPLCCPARATLLTGQYSTTTGW